MNTIARVCNLCKTSFLSLLKCCGVLEYYMTFWQNVQIFGWKDVRIWTLREKGDPLNLMDLLFPLATYLDSIATTMTSVKVLL